MNLGEALNEVSEQIESNETQESQLLTQETTTPTEAQEQPKGDVIDLEKIKQERDAAVQQLEYIRQLALAEQQKAIEEQQKQQALLAAEAAKQKGQDVLEIVRGLTQQGLHAEAMHLLTTYQAEQQMKQVDQIVQQRLSELLAPAISKKEFLSAEELKPFHGLADLAVELEMAGIPRAKVLEYLYRTQNYYQKQENKLRQGYMESPDGSSAPPARPERWDEAYDKALNNFFNSQFGNRKKK